MVVMLITLHGVGRNQMGSESQHSFDKRCSVEIDTVISFAVSLGGERQGESEFSTGNQEVVSLCFPWQ